MPSNELIGSLPDELFALSNLRIMYVKENSLTGSIATEIGQLSNLGKFIIVVAYGPATATQLCTLVIEHLLANSNGLTGSIPTELGLNTNLVILNFSTNLMRSEIPPELGQLTMLESLNLAAARVVGTLPTELGNLRSLRILDLAGNTRLTGTIPSELVSSFYGYFQFYHCVLSSQRSIFY